jgi:serine/threonine protein kinase
MHKHKIVNKDIKQKNIMLYLDPNKISKLKNVDMSNKIPDILDIMNVRYIDFGLSKYILPSQINKKSIDLSGTYRYLAPERYISYSLIKYNTKSIDYVKKEIKEKTKHVKEALQRIGEDSMINNLEETISKLYKKIIFLHQNDTLIDKYFGLNTSQNYNSYIQKSDIYALGITIFDTLQYKDYSNVDVRENTLLYDLLLKMIEIDPDKRYNIVECINHSYFTN